MPLSACRLSRILSGLAVMLALVSGAAIRAETGVGVRHLSLVDETRGVKASGGFAGSPTRRIDVAVWYPAGAAGAGAAPAASNGPYPLVIYSHGSFGQADNAMYLVQALVRAGYIVAAPDYPLSSRAAYTRIKSADTSDVANQTRDVRFVIDRLLADKDLAPLIAPARIATIGHSLGAVTSYFASFGSGVRDARIKATVLLGAGDPVQAALSANMGLVGTWHVAKPVPVLFLSAEHDAIARFTGRPGAAYARLEPPKYELTIKGGAHVWFATAASVPADGSNPDCAFMGGGKGMPGCESGLKMTTPARQQAATVTAVLDFLAAYLDADKARLMHLRKLPGTMADVTARRDD